jgi:predicted deacylase
MVEKQDKQQNRFIQKEPLIFYRRIRVRSTGIIDYLIQPGDSIQKGQILGKIRNVFGKEIEKVVSPVEGILFSHEDQSIVFPGQNLFTVAVEC